MSGPDPAVGRRIGPYVIVRRLGQGGLGTVYEALDEAVSRRVALKVYHAAFAADTAQRERIAREARVAARVRHRSLLPIHRLFVDDGMPCIAMQLVEGGSLADVLARLRAEPERRLSRATFLAAARAVVGTGAGPPAPTPGPAGDPGHAETVAWIGREIASALAALHGADIVHRDVKPGNVLLAADGRVYLSDFGLARDETLATLTRSGEFLGTPRYLAPEQIRGERAGARSDVYGLGATLYELLALEPAFGEADTHRLTEQIESARFRPLRAAAPSVPADLAAIVEHCLERDPRDRYPTALDLAADLQRFQRHEAVAASRPSRARRLLRAARRRPIATAAVAAGALALALGAGLVARESGVRRAAQAAAVREEAAAAGSLVDRCRSASAAGDWVALAEALRDSAGRTHGGARETELEQAEAALAEATARLVRGVLDAPLPTNPATFLAAARELRSIVELFPSAARRTGADATAAALADARAIEEALALDPVVDQLFDRNAAGLEETVRRLFQWLARESRLALLIASDSAETVLLPGRDFVAIGTPSIRTGSGGAGFAGYGLRAPEIGRDDYADLEWRGKFALALRGIPPAVNDPAARAALEAGRSRKSLEASRRGVRALILIDGTDEAADWADLERTAQLSTRTAVPTLIVRHSAGLSWLRGEVDLVALAQSQPAAARDLPNLRFELVPAPGSPRDRASTLAPLLERVVRDSKPSVRQLVPFLAVLLPGERATCVLERLLQDPDPIVVGITAMLLAHQPRAALRGALLELLAAQTGPGSEAAARSVIDSDKLTYCSDWLFRQRDGSFEMGSVELEILSALELPFDTPYVLDNDLSPRALVFGALDAVDSAAAMPFAEALLREGEWPAIEVLVRDRGTACFDLLATALQAGATGAEAAFGRADAITQHKLASPAFRTRIARALAAGGDRRGLDEALRLLERTTRAARGSGDGNARLTVGVLEILVQFDEATGAEPLFAHLTTLGSGERRVLFEQWSQWRSSDQALFPLLQPQRLSACAARVGAALRRPGTADREAALDLLERLPFAGAVPEAIAVPLLDLCRAGDARTRSRALRAAIAFAPEVWPRFVALLQSGDAEFAQAALARLAERPSYGAVARSHLRDALAVAAEDPTRCFASAHRALEFLGRVAERLPPSEWPGELADAASATLDAVRAALEPGTEPLEFVARPLLESLLAAGGAEPATARCALAVARLAVEGRYPPEDSLALLAIDAFALCGRDADARDFGAGVLRRLPEGDAARDRISERLRSLAPAAPR